MTALAAQPRTGGRQAALRSGEELNVDKQPPVCTRGMGGAISRASPRPICVNMGRNTTHMCHICMCRLSG